MLTNNKKMGGAAALAFAMALTHLPMARATEPANNKAPWIKPDPSFRGDVSYFGTTAISNGWGTPEPVTANDTDYHIVACGGYEGATGTLSYVRIDFTHAMGDIDMMVYRLDGTIIATSTGLIDREFIDLNAENRGAVVLKVYGYGGAPNAGGYKVSMGCK